MKLTDYCILFGVILMSLFVYNELKLQAVNETQVSQMLLNINMDEIVVDGLNAGFVGVNAMGDKLVDLNAASECIFKEMSVLLYGKNDMQSMAQKYVKALIYVEENGYYIYENGVWSEKISFNEESTHSERVEIVSKLIEEKVGAVSLIAYNDGESYKNTIGDNTLIIAYLGYNFMTSECTYTNSYLSAASIKLKD